MSASATQDGHNDNDYHLSLILSGLDNLHSRRKQLIQRFIDRIFLHSSSCLNYLLPEQQEFVSKLCRAKNMNPFWATVCKTVRPMLSDRCPVSYTHLTLPTNREV